MMSIMRANFDGTSSKAVPKLPKVHDARLAAYKNGARVTGVYEDGGVMRFQYDDLLIDVAQPKPPRLRRNGRKLWRSESCNL